MPAKNKTAKELAAPSQALIKAKAEPKGILANLKLAEQEAREGFMRMASMLSGDVKPEALAWAYNVIDKDWKKIIEAQREAVRQALLELAKENGEDGKLDLTYGGDRFTVKRTVQRTWDGAETKLKELLTAKGIKLDTVFKQVISVEIDKAELDRLVAEETLTQQELDDAKRIKSQTLGVEKQ